MGHKKKIKEPVVEVTPEKQEIDQQDWAAVEADDPGLSPWEQKQWNEIEIKELEKEAEEIEQQIELH